MDDPCDDMLLSMHGCRLVLSFWTLHCTAVEATVAVALPVPMVDCRYVFLERASLLRMKKTALWQRSARCGPTRLATESHSLRQLQVCRFPKPPENPIKQQAGPTSLPATLESHRVVPAAECHTRLCSTCLLLETLQGSSACFDNQMPPRKPLLWSSNCQVAMLH